jgi:hypothetical protein
MSHCRKSLLMAGGGVGGGSAGERALSHLPLLLTLFESCLDALAEGESQDSSKPSDNGIPEKWDSPPLHNH